MTPLSPGARIGDWIVEGRLGEGGMATVYACRHALTARLTAAVKLLRPAGPGEDPDKWFQRETETLAALQHPGIVRILHPGVDPHSGQRFLAMERVDGQTLRQRLRSAPLGARAARELFASVAEALAAAHAANIFHRDIKPSNIMIRENGTPVLLDFGIATAADPDEQTHTAVGTPTYMAPELFYEGAFDPARADLYSFGVVLFESLTNQPPFGETVQQAHTSERVAATIAAKLRTPHLDPGPSVDPALQSLVRRLTALEPFSRPASMAAVAAALRAEPQLRPPLPPTAPPPPPRPLAAPPQPPPDSTLRNWIIGALIVTVALSTIFGVAAWFIVLSL